MFKKKEINKKAGAKAPVIWTGFAVTLAFGSAAY